MGLIGPINLVFRLSPNVRPSDLLAIGILLPIVILGPGRFALGRFLHLPTIAGNERPITVLE